NLLSFILEGSSQVRVLAHIHIVAYVIVNDGLVVFFTHGALADEEVVKVDRRDYDSEDTDATQNALHLETVVKSRGGE
ncbi:MAG: hypothetical protein IIU45_07685, partial [Lachnospiraceae bacterium]|nr:hypothetical protein [Lachnospiraceae bacterium]